MTPQRRETPEAQQVYADSGLPWREVARKLDAELAEKIRRITELETAAASASVIAPGQTAIQKVLDCVNRLCVGGVATADELAEIAIMVGEVQHLRAASSASVIAPTLYELVCPICQARGASNVKPSASVIAEMPHNIATCACMSCSMARSSMQIQIEASVIAEMQSLVENMEMIAQNADGIVSTLTASRWAKDLSGLLSRLQKGEQP